MSGVLRIRSDPKKKPKVTLKPTSHLEIESSRGEQARAIDFTESLKYPEEDQAKVLDVIEMAEILDREDNVGPETQGDEPFQNEDENPEIDPVQEVLPELAHELEECLSDADDFFPEDYAGLQGVSTCWVDAHYATDPDGNPQAVPMPSIEINEFGDVLVLQEANLNLCLDHSVTVEMIDTDNSIGKGVKRADILRAFGKAIVKHNPDVLFYGPDVFEEAIPRLAPLIQKDLFSGVTVPANSTVLVAHTCVKTPLWGIVPLSAFIRKSDEWELTIEEVREIIDGENPSKPYLFSEKSSRWKMLVEKRDHLGNLEEANHLFRTNMDKYGIPLTTGRRHIYECTKKWFNANSVSMMEVSIDEISEIVTELIDHYELFNTKKTLKYREDRFRAFTGNRVLRVLQLLGVKVV